MLFDRPGAFFAAFSRTTIQKVRHWSRPNRRMPATAAANRQQSSIFARVKPEKVSIVEKYQYHQVLAVNPVMERGEAGATGSIEVVVPYDGHRFFTRDAIKDVQRQIGESATEAVGDTEAVVGHLVLVNLQDTKRVDGSPLAGMHGAIPLRVPVRSRQMNDNDLSSDRFEAALRIDYVPPRSAAHPFPIKIEIGVFDPDDRKKPIEEFQRSWAKEVSEQIVRQPAFSSELLLTMTVWLHWPRRSAKKAPKMNIKHVSLVWPTITSLEPNSLRFLLGERPAEVQYNPATMSLEWIDIPIGQDPDGESGASADTIDADGEHGPKGSDRGASNKEDAADADDEDDDPVARTPAPSDYARPPEKQESDDDDDTSDDEDDEEPDDGAVSHIRSEEMRLFIRQPGQLRNEKTLQGTVEVEVEDDLLSGIDVRLFNASGERHRRGTLVVKTRLTLTFTLSLEDEFNRRMMSATHALHFDEVVPSNERIEDMTAALGDRGFDVVTHTADERTDNPEWYIAATRIEGPNKIELFIVVRGRRYTTRRRAQNPGWHRYDSEVDSGELRLTIHGSVPRNSRELTTEVNELRRSLTSRFRHVKAQR